ncbi:MAG: putative ABC transporter permease [Clostridia bacterium]
MNLFFKLCFLFFIGSLSGWCIELVFRRFFSSTKKWINPGFLNGPYLPIYGFGICLFYLMSQASLDFIVNPFWRDVFRLTSMCILVTLIEYIVGILFTKVVKVKLWDYSRRWGNIQGVICPLFSLFWFAFGALFYFVLYNLFTQALDWFANNITFCFVLGLFYGILIVDLGISLNVLGKIRGFVKESKVIVHYDNLKASIRNELKELEQKSSFIFPFSKGDLRHSLKRYLDSLAIDESKNKILEVIKMRKNSKK